MSWDRILVATDYSDTALRALNVAAELAGRLGAELLVAHVVDLRGQQLAFPELAPYVDIAALLKGLEEEARRAMPAFVARGAVPAGVKVTTEVRAGIPVDDILTMAKERKVDAIVLGTHGRSGFSRLWFGSIAEKIVRLAHKPVLTVGPEESTVG